MILSLAYCSRIFPLTENTWNAAFGPEITVREIEMWCYSEPSIWVGGEGIQGRLLQEHELSEKHGQFFLASFSHAFLQDQTLLDLIRKRNRGNEYNQFERNSVRIERRSNGQLFIQVFERGTHEVWFETSMPFDSEGAPIKSWMKPMSNQSFVDTVLDLGKGYVHCGQKKFRFSEVYEFLPGAVYTRDCDTGKAHVYVDLGPWGDKIKLEQLAYPSEQLPKNVLKIDVGNQDSFDSECVNERSTYFRTLLGQDVKGDQNWLLYAWQQRVDLLPENW